MSLLDKYEKVAAEQSKVMQVVTTIAKESLPFIILLINVVVSIVFSLYDPSLKNPWTPDFFVRLLTNILSTMLCYSCFVSYGEKNAKMGSEAYAKNLKRWSEISNTVRNGSSTSFMEYCRKQVEIERAELRHYYILNYTMITIEEYEEKYKKLSDEAIDKLVASGELHKREAKYLKKANKPRYLKPINPILILCGVNKLNLNDVGRDGMSASAMSIAMRPAFMFAVSTLGAMLSATWKGIDSASAVFHIVWSVLMIILASITGYTSGTDAGNKEHDKIKARIFFLERYISAEEKTEQ